MLVYCSTQHPSEMQHLVAHALGLRRTTRHGRVPAHGRRLRRQGDAGRRCSPASPRWPRARPAAPVKLRARPRRRHADHRQAPRLPRTTTRSASTTTAASSALELDAGVALRLLGRPVRRRSTTARCSTPTTPTGCRDVRDRIATAARRTPSQHRLPRLRRAAGHDRDREHDRRRSRARSASTRSTCGSANSTASDERNVTPYGRRSRTTSLHELIDELEATSATTARGARRSRAFNAASPVLKRGIALTPVKFGISFTVTHFNQAGALVHVYTDGIDAGEPRRHRDGPGPEHQGRAGGRRRARRRRSTACAITATDTSKVANTSATAASTGTDLNGKAAQDAARTITRAAGRVRGRALTAATPEQVALRGRPGAASASTSAAASPSWCAQAYLDARAAVVRPASTPRPRSTRTARRCTRPAVLLLRLRRGRVSEVVDRHADRRVPAAARRHPARRRPLAQPGDRHRPDRGRLHPGHGLADDRGAGAGTTTGVLTHPRALAPTRSRPPTTCRPTSTCASGSRATTARTAIHRSKAVGEPPLMLGFSVFFAIRDAIASRPAAGSARRSTRRPRRSACCSRSRT